MRRVATAIVAVACLLAVVRVPAQEPARSDQTFRTGVDVIRLDVTVLDKKRQPIRGLTANDFVVKENGRVQRIVAVTEVDGSAADPAPSAWMRHAAPDVTSNDLADRLGEGQAVAIILDDLTIPQESVEMIGVGARDCALHRRTAWVRRTWPPSSTRSNPAAREDFTRDRSKLLAAIDKFDPEQPEYRYLQPRYSGPMEGDIQRYNTALGRDPCLQIQPVIPTLRAVTSRLATVPNRRKALFYLSQGLAFTFTPGRTRCQGLALRRAAQDVRDRPAIQRQHPRHRSCRRGRLSAPPPAAAPP